MSMDGGEIRIPVRLDLSQIADDIAAIDPEVARLQRRMQAVYNQGRQVRAGRAPRAESIETVGENRQAWTPAVQRLDQRLGQRLQEIERAARRGATAPPPTPAQAQRQAAQTRLDQVARQTKPTQVEFTQTSIDKFGRAIMRQAGPNLASMAMAKGHVGGAGGIMRLLMSAAEGDPLLMAALVGGGLVGGAALAVNSSQVQFQRQAATLATASVGGPALGSSRSALGLALGRLSPAFSVSASDVNSIAQSLATAGVPRNNLVSMTKTALQLAGPNMLPFGDIAGLTGALGTTGGMSSGGISTLYQNVENAAHDSGVSIKELTDSMKALQTNALGAAKDVVGLAAVQRLIGASSGINAGAALAPALSSLGTQAMAQGALLGLNPQQFAYAQAHPAVMYDRIAGLVRRVDRGPQGTNIAESILQQQGLVDFSKMNPGQAASLLTTMRNGSPQAAEAAAQQLLTKTTRQQLSQDEAARRAAAAMEHLATAGERAGYGLDYVWTAISNNLSPEAPGTAQAQARSFWGPASTQAQVFQQQRLRSGLSVSTPGGAVKLPYDIAMIDLAAAAAHGIDPAALIAMQARESGFNPKARSADGGLGLAQFTDPSVARKYLGANWRTAALDPTKAANAQAAYYADLLKQYGGNAQMAMAAYNGGPNWQSKQAAVQYGQQTYAAQQNVDQALNITVTVVDRTERGVSAKVDKTRQRTGYKSYVPTHH